MPILLERSLGLGMELRPYLESGQLLARQVDPLELSPGKFAHMVRAAVEDGGARTVIIDSLTGYMASMGDEASLMLQVRNLLTYLGEHGVTTLLVSVQHGLIGSVDAPAGQVSYLADTVDPAALLRACAARCAGRYRCSSAAPARTSVPSATSISLRAGSASDRRCGSSGASSPACRNWQERVEPG